MSRAIMLWLARRKPRVRAPSKCPMAPLHVVPAMRELDEEQDEFDDGAVAATAAYAVVADDGLPRRRNICMRSQLQVIGGFGWGVTCFE